MHEDIVHPLDDAVTIYPKVLAVAVVPVSVDPNPARTGRNLPLGHDGPRRRWGLLRGSDGLGLLDDDHCFAIDLLRRAFLGFDDHVGRQIWRFGGLPLSGIAIVRHRQLVRCPPAVAIRPLVIGECRNGENRRTKEYKESTKPKENHDPSFLA